MQHSQLDSSKQRLRRVLSLLQMLSIFGMQMPELIRAHYGEIPIKSRLFSPYLVPSRHMRRGKTTICLDFLNTLILGPVSYLFCLLCIYTISLAILWTWQPTIFKMVSFHWYSSCPMGTKLKLITHFSWISSQE
jgi:hypothetical protein